MDSRRDFIRKAGGLGLLAFGGCRCPTGCVRGDAVSPNYWCTWGIQNRMLGKVKRSPLAFAGDQGAARARDNINEDLVFGKGGWTGLFPKSRERLWMMLDDGWDVPYGTLPSASTVDFALMDPYPARFPSLGATRRARLTNLNGRLMETGWRGAGLWVACQCHGESDCLSYVPSGKARAEWRAKIEDCAAAGIGYLKVDWGMRSGSVGFRRMLSELAREIAPGMIVEHKPMWSHPFNYVKVLKESERVGGPGRMLDALRAEVNPEDNYDRQVFAFSDVVRIYDMLRPLDRTTALERVAAFSELIDGNGFGTMLNVEDVPTLGAILGHAFGVMRSDGDDLSEVDRAVAWQALAPAFGGRPDFKTAFSDETLTDEWRYARGEGWLEAVWEKLVYQKAPAVIARGTALAEVRSREAERPYVLSGRHPNGALAVGTMPRLTGGRSWTPIADIALEEEAREGMPLAVFGALGSLTLRDGAPRARVYARDLLGKEFEDITAACRRRDGRLALPGDVLGRIGTRGAPNETAPAGSLVVLSDGRERLG